MSPSSPTTVVSVTTINPNDDAVVRIDAGSDWASPYRVGEDGTRPQVVAKYRTYLQTRPDLLDRLDELRGRRLACWCPPLPCHGDVLVELVDRDDPAGELDVDVLVERSHGCGGDECRVPGCDRSGSPVARPEWSTVANATTGPNGPPAPAPTGVGVCPHEGCANPATVSRKRRGGRWWRVCADHGRWKRGVISASANNDDSAQTPDLDLDRPGSCPVNGCGQPTTTNRQRTNGGWWRVCADHADDEPSPGG